MSTFDEANSVEHFVRDLLCGKQPAITVVAETPPAYHAGVSNQGAGWQSARPWTPARSPRE